MATPQELRGNPAAAIAELESFITSNAGNAAAHHRLGQLYQSVASPQKALTHFAEAVRLKPSDLNYRKMLADFQYVETGDIESAITNYVQILKLNPNDTENLTILGNIATSISRFEEARVFYSKVVELEPWNAAARDVLNAITAKLAPGPPVPAYEEARAAAEGGNTDEAIALLGRIVASDDRHAVAHNDLGVLLSRRGDTEAALEHYRRAVELDPGNRIFARNLADFYYQALGRYEDAMRIYNELLKSNPADTEVLMVVGLLCAEAGEIGAAESFFRAVLAHDPDHGPANTALRHLDRSPMGEQDAEDGIPDHPRLDRILKEKERHARQYLGDVLQKDPRNMHARRNLDSLNGRPDEAPVQAMYAESVRLVNSGDVAAATAILKRILAADPTVAVANNDLAVLAYRSGDRDTALHHYQEAVRLEPANVTYRKNLADFYFVEMGRPEEALQMYVAALHQNPRDVETLLSLGSLCAEIGRADDARSFMSAATALDPGNEMARTVLQALANG